MSKTKKIIIAVVVLAVIVLAIIFGGVFGGGTSEVTPNESDSTSVEVVVDSLELETVVDSPVITE